MPVSHPEPWLRIAAILRPHGIRGELVADILTDFPERLSTGATLHLRLPGHAFPVRTVTVERSRLHDGRALLTLTGCTTRDHAETLRGHELVIPASERTAPDADSIHLADLIGAQLFDRATSRAAGEITGIDRESSNRDLLVIRTHSGDELLVPFVKAYTPAWDHAARRLTLTLPEGLLTINADTPPA